ncbi:hypothetical protein V5799_000620 [Amblyomma americanum]|uniref:Uncharacterized protein n=1 Tax=Amblyomma americanum TaxID=6943 RepID=A0AAQ4D2I6_AMBAM
MSFSPPFAEWLTTRTEKEKQRCLSEGVDVFLKTDDKELKRSNCVLHRVVDHFVPNDFTLLQADIRGPSDKHVRGGGRPRQGEELRTYQTEALQAEDGSSGALER